MKIHRQALGPAQANCYIIDEAGQALVVDPGAEGDRILAALEDLGVTPLAILLTHAHVDHIGAVDDLRDRYAIPLYLDPAEDDWLTDPRLNASAFMGQPLTVEPGPDHAFKAGDLAIGPFSFEVRQTPGHSPGGVSLVFHDQDLVLTGDALFRQSIGRTDLAGGDTATLLASIQEELFSLPDHYQVLPGHGPSSTIGFEKDNNPFLQGL